MISNTARSKINLNRIYSNSASLSDVAKGRFVCHTAKNVSKCGKQNVPLPHSEKVDRMNLLNKFGLPVEDNLLGGIEVLEKHGVNLSKKNLLEFVSAKKNLNFIAKNLNTDIVQQLQGEEVDIRREPLQKISDYIKNMKNERPKRSLLTLIGAGKKLSAQDSERIAKELYGSKMGKDVKDAIGALHKAGAEITKRNVNLINDTLGKLNQLKNNEDETIVKTIKKNMEPNIENLIKTKNNITKNTVVADEKLSQAATANYEKLLMSEVLTAKRAITDKELAVMEDEIKELLVKEGIKSTKENVELAKELIKNQVPVNKENIENIRLSKEAIETLQKQLSHEKLALLYKAGVNVEKEPVTELVELINSIEEEGKIIDKSANSIATDDEKISSIISRLNKFGSMQDKDMILILKKGVDFKIGLLNKLVLSSTTQKTSFGEDIALKSTYTNIVEVVNSFNMLADIGMDTIAKQVSTSSLTSLDSLVLAHQNTKNALSILSSGANNNSANDNASSINFTDSNTKDAVIAGAFSERGARLALINNNIEANQLNTKQLFEINKQFNYIKHNITSLMIKNSFNDNIMGMELGKLNEYIINQERFYNIDQMMSLLPRINSSGDSILPMLMKNNIPLILKEAENMFLLFDNQKQIGEQIGNVLSNLENEQGQVAKNEAREIRQLLTQITNEIKLGDVDFDKIQDKIAKSIELLQDAMSGFSGKTSGELEKTLNNLLNSLEFQNQMNKNNFVLQFPIMMSEFAKNLQLFVTNHKKGSKKIDPKDMSLLLNIDTNSMDNVNIYIAIKNNQAVIKFGVKEQKHKNIIESSINDLKLLMKEVGYDIKNLSFRVDEEASIKSIIEVVTEKEIKTRHYIDITI